MNESIEHYIELYGQPLIRFYPEVYTEHDRLHGDIPEEIAVFKIPHPSRVMVVGRAGKRWIANYGQRAVVAKLLDKIDEIQK